MARGDVVLDLEKALFVLQKKDKETGEWQIQPSHIYTGKTDARIALLKQRAEDREGEWRSVLKQEAERYREGWKDAMLYIDTEFELEPEYDSDSEDSRSQDLVSGSGSGTRRPRS
ncbi:MAG: hypothetical protein E6R04_09215 [Spirochaetes bacterium]|jgi:hypothetical protein|nr:MAG: hypothetical protein E6R04_09215 [Spirochaetota bacterium]